MMNDPARKGSSSARAMTPKHYEGEGGMQPWDVVDAFELDYYRGSALKYLLRAGRKDSYINDLRKAAHFLARAIERAEEEPQFKEFSTEERLTHFLQDWHNPEKRAGR